MKHTVLRIIMVICLSISHVATAQTAYVLPDMGNSSRVGLSQAEELALGTQIMRDIQQANVIINDVITQSYIQNLGLKLVKNSPKPNDHFYFFILNANSINAFALPGGFIGVHAGLMLTAENESELAAVVGHEIAHVTQQHIARMIEKAKQFTLPTMAALLGGFILATQSPEAGTGAIVGTLAAAQQAAINFTRGNEKEADRVGIDILAESGFNPNSMADFFARMDKANQYNQGGHVPEFLLTHPVSSVRIADANNRSKNYSKPKKTDESQFNLIKQRVNVIASRNQAHTLTSYKEQIKKTSRKKSPHIYYGYALSLSESLTVDEAIKEIQALIKLYPNEVLYELTLAEFEQNRENHQEGIDILSHTLKTYPRNHVVTLTYAEALLNNEDAALAQQTLRHHIKFNNEDPKLYDLLARAEGMLNNNISAHRARSEYFALMYDYPAAIRQLELALNIEPISDYQKQTIEARLKQLEGQRENVKKYL